MKTQLTRITSITERLKNVAQFSVKNDKQQRPAYVIITLQFIQLR